jgi:hypothetical protein
MNENPARFNSLVLCALLLILWLGPPTVQPSAQPSTTPAEQTPAYLSTQTIIGAMIVGLISGIIGALCTGFFTERGKQLAITTAQERILQELRDTTKAVKQIEADISLRRYVGEAEVEYREKQLAEFYGPIYGSIKLTGRLWRLYIEGKLAPIGAEMNQLFREQNNEIVQVLKSKFYLVEGDKIPSSFSDYLTSVMLFNIGTVKGGGFSPQEIANLPEAKFPTDFFNYIISTTEALKAALDKLYKEYRLAVRVNLPQAVEEHAHPDAQP